MNELNNQKGGHRAARAAKKYANWKKKKYTSSAGDAGDKLQLWQILH